MSENKILVHAENVCKSFRQGDQVIQALRGISLDIYRGEYLSIMGPSGSGKSTLFNMIGALDRPTAGEITIQGVAIPALASRELSYFRCRYIGYVFQSYNLIPSLSALENVSLPAIFLGLAPAEAQAAAMEALEYVGLGNRHSHRPGELSGGQQQRVAIARALVNKPAILLADEPTANLDFNTGAAIIKVFKDLSVDRGVTVISATHDHKMLANSDRVVWIKSGEVERIRTKAELDIHLGSINGRVL
ncbi:MAG: ABC transporter ATP-binding protein [Spirochaetes bacterium]|nr:ABC transporter ATP-binding protein [Spirochaetota bacterium]